MAAVMEEREEWAEERVGAMVEGWGAMRGDMLSPTFRSSNHFQELMAGFQRKRHVQKWQLSEEP